MPVDPSARVDPNPPPHNLNHNVHNLHNNNGSDLPSYMRHHHHQPIIKKYQVNKLQHLWWGLQFNMYQLLQFNLHQCLQFIHQYLQFNLHHCLQFIQCLQFNLHQCLQFNMHQLLQFNLHQSLQFTQQCLLKHLQFITHSSVCSISISYIRVSCSIYICSALDHIPLPPNNDESDNDNFGILPNAFSKSDSDHFPFSDNDSDDNFGILLKQ